MKAVILSIIMRCISSYSYAQINIQVPKPSGNNYSQVAQTMNVSGNDDIRISLVQTANKYLRTILIVVLVVVLIITGFKLMSGESKESNKSLINMLVALLIAIFSYTIIRLLINLF